MRPSIFVLIILIAANFLTFHPSLKLGLFGDDWLALFNYQRYLGPNSSGQWNHFTFFLTSYGPQEIVMGLLQKIYGFNSFYYQLTSYLLRLVASFSIYPIVWYLTRNKQSAFFAILFFSVTTVGLETTVWVFNMTSYIAIFFLNLFFFFYLKSHFEQNIKLLILSGFLFGITFILQPIRMHGLLPLIIVMELFWLLQKPSKILIKQFLLRIFLFVCIFIVIFFALSKSPIASSSSVSNEIMITLIKIVYEGKVNLLLNPVNTLGSIFIPMLNDSDSYLFAGSAAVLIWTLLIIKFRKDQKIATALFFSLAWAVSSFLFAWLRFPESILTSTHRYLIVSAVGVSILFATIFVLGRNLGSRISLFSILSLILILHISSTRSYLNQNLLTHNQEVTNKIWSQIPHIPEIGKSAEPLVFYFEGEDINRSILRDSVTFGFPFHMALLYGIPDENRNPIPMTDWKDIESVVLDGKAFAPHAKGKILDPIPPERVYAFHLQGKDNLINITADVRKKLIDLVKNEH